MAVYRSCCAVWYHAIHPYSAAFSPVLRDFPFGGVGAGIHDRPWMPHRSCCAVWYHAPTLTAVEAPDPAAFSPALRDFPFGGVGAGIHDRPWMAHRSCCAVWHSPSRFPMHLTADDGRFTIKDYGKLTRISAGEVGAVEMRAWEVGGGESSTVCVPIRVPPFPKSKLFRFLS